MPFNDSSIFRRNINSDFEVGFHKFVPFENRAARILNTFFDNDLYSFGRRPVIDESDDGYTVTLELPGFKQTDLDITIEKDTLTIVAKRGEQVYDQSFTIPHGVDSEGTDAKLEDGILTISLKKSASSKPRKVTIK